MTKCFSAKLAEAGDDLIEWDDLVCDGRILNRDDNESYAENLLSLSHLATRVPTEPSQVWPLTHFLPAEAGQVLLRFLLLLLLQVTFTTFDHPLTTSFYNFYSFLFFELFF